MISKNPWTSSSSEISPLELFYREVDWGKFKDDVDNKDKVEERKEKEEDGGDDGDNEGQEWSNERKEEKGSYLFVHNLRAADEVLLRKRQTRRQKEMRRVEESPGGRFFRQGDRDADKDDITISDITTAMKRFHSFHDRHRDVSLLQQLDNEARRREAENCVLYVDPKQKDHLKSMLTLATAASQLQADTENGPETLKLPFCESAQQLMIDIKCLEQLADRLSSRQKSI